MHARQPTPQSVITEYILRKLISDPRKNQFVFTALKVSSNFATETTMHIIIQNKSIQLIMLSLNVSTRIEYPS